MCPDQKLNLQPWHIRIMLQPTEPPSRGCKVFHKPRRLVLWFPLWLSVSWCIYTLVYVPLCSSTGVGQGVSKLLIQKWVMIVNPTNFWCTKSRPSLMNGLIRWTFVWGRARKRWGHWGCLRTFAEFVWTHSDLSCIWWKFCTHLRCRGNPRDLAAAWSGWMEKSVTSVLYLAPLWFLGMEEKGSTTL